MKRPAPFLPASVACAVCASLSLASAAAHADDPTVDPCSLLTKAEVEQSVGKLKAAPKSGRNDRLLTCEYQFANDKNELLVWVMPATAMDRARKQFKDLTPVKGLGEE